MNDALRLLLREIASEAGEARLHVVGGFVRDLALGRDPRDLDLVVGERADADGLAARLGARPGWHLKAAHGRFGTATLASPSGLRVDLAVARKETYTKPGALPTVTPGASLEEDLARRDFAVHAMAMSLLPDASLGPLVDPFGGKRDLESRRLRLLHERSLADDPTRAFRAVRYGARLGFEIAEPSFTRALELSRASGAWQTISGDRLRRSIEEVLSEPRWGPAVARLFELGILATIEPAWCEPPGDAETRAEGIARRWNVILSPLDAAGRGRVAARLVFPRKMRREVGSDT